jgi:hypothetical protein
VSSFLVLLNEVIKGRNLGRRSIGNRQAT